MAARTRLAGLALLLACGRGEPPSPPALPALAGPVSLLRLPRAGGQAEAFLPGDLAPAGWTSSGRLSPLRRPLGADLDERLVFAVDSAGNLVALDLETGTSRGNVLTGVTAAIMAADGSIYAVDRDRRVVHLLRRSPTRYRTPLPGTPRFLAGALNDRLVAVTAGDQPELVVLGVEAPHQQQPVPEGRAAATLWGDLIAVAADTALVVLDTQHRDRRWSARLGGGVAVAAFSPSAHRIYVGRSRGDLVVLDRFSRDIMATVALPAPIEAIRPDMTGRWLLLHPVGTDSVWVLDATTHRMTARFPTRWDEDLPVVAGASQLILRAGQAVESWDLSQPVPARTGRVAGGATDLWALIAWVPPAHRSQARAAIDEASGTQDSALVFGAIPPPALAPAPRVFLQISSSQNPGWARELARQLAAAGFPAAVRDPVLPDEGYRVVLGPYPSREAAEEAGRQLGRPFFVLSEGSSPPAR